MEVSISCTDWCTSRWGISANPATRNEPPDVPWGGNHTTGVGAGLGVAVGEGTGVSAAGGSSVGLGVGAGGAVEVAVRTISGSDVDVDATASGVVPTTGRGVACSESTGLAGGAALEQAEIKKTVKRAITWKTQTLALRGYLIPSLLHRPPLPNVNRSPLSGHGGLTHINYR